MREKFSESSLSIKLMLALDRACPPALDLSKIDAHFQQFPSSILAVDGYFQYDTNLMFSDNVYRQTLIEILFPSESGVNPFQKQIWLLQEQVQALTNGYYVFGIHVRRGDYVHLESIGALQEYYTMDLAVVISEISKYINRNRVVNPIIYFASDDLHYCSDYFSHINFPVLTRMSLLNESGRDSLTELFLDIAVLSMANCFIASNSSLSILAALLNSKARIFMRQSQEGDLVPFDPHNTPVLYGAGASSN